MDDDLYREQVEEGRRREQMQTYATPAEIGVYGLNATKHSLAAQDRLRAPCASFIAWSGPIERPRGSVDPCGNCGRERVLHPGHSTRHPASQKFHDLLALVGSTHDAKQRDYGSATDPFANVRSSQDFGVAPWIGALIRLNDKVTRLKAFATRGELANESAEDSMLDISVYALIALLLYREEVGEDG